MPQDGDVVLTRRTASPEHDVVILSSRQVIARARYDLAVAAGRQAAEQFRVDLWMTEDHTHFWRLATYRKSGR